MSILSSWLNRKIRLTDGNFWAAWFGGSNWAGKDVTVDSALQLSTFWAAVRLKASTIGALPVGLYLKDAQGGRKAQIDDRLYSIIHDQPNSEQTAVEFWEGMVASILIQGNAFSEKTVTAVGDLANLGPPMAPHLMQVLRKDNVLTYRYYDRGKHEEFPADKIFHIRGFGFGGDVGLSPLQYARQTLSASMATDEAAARTFSNGMRPGGFFTYDKTLTPEQRVQAKTVLIDPYVGSENSNKIGILEAGFKWQDVMMNPEDAQMLQTRSFQVEEICRWVGVPPILIGHAAAGQTMWGSGIEQIILGWLTLSLASDLKRIEQAAKRSLLTVAQKAKGLYIEFNTDALLRADSAARSAFFSTMVQNGIMTRNEARSKDNLPSMPGADILTVQVNMTDLTMLGEVQNRNEALRMLVRALREAEGIGDLTIDVPPSPRLEHAK